MLFKDSKIAVVWCAKLKLRQQEEMFKIINKSDLVQTVAREQVYAEADAVERGSEHGNERGSEIEMKLERILPPTSNHKEPLQLRWK